MSESRETKGLSDAEMLARVLHRDGLMLVIDKPAGLPVHRGPKGGANLEASFDTLRFGLPNPPVLAHRLDRDTSGCLILGRHRKATATLGLLFKHGRIGKTYWAVVQGGPVEDEGVINLPIGRLNAERGWWRKIDVEHGLPSETRWKVLGRGAIFPPPALPAPSPHSPSKTGVNALSLGERWGGGSPNSASETPTPDPSPQGGGEYASQVAYTWLALEPVTGRTHQLRVHCAAIGWPILGDVIYGDVAVERRARNGAFVPQPGEAPLHLHAREIVIPLSRNKPPVRVIAPVPEHMRELLKACGWEGE